MGEITSSRPAGLPQPAAHMEVVRTRNREKQGEYIIQQAYYKDPQTGRGCEFWQVTRADRKPMPSGHPAEIFSKKNQAMTLCLKLAGPIEKKPKRTRTKNGPIAICELSCANCGAPYLEKVYRGQHPDTLKRKLCLECWKKEETAKNMTKAREMGLPDFATGSTAQIGYAFSVRQKFVDGILEELEKTPERKELFLNEVKQQSIPKWWLDHNTQGTLKNQFQSFRRSDGTPSQT